MEVQDPEMYSLINDEIMNQRNKINLISSENYCSRAVYDCLSTPLQNKYLKKFQINMKDKIPQRLDDLEFIAKKRALELFKLDEDEWDVIVQCYSGSVANKVVYDGILEPGDRVLGMHRQEGGHISHGLRYGSEIINYSAKFYHWEHYGIDENDFVDYNQMNKVI